MQAKTPNDPSRRVSKKEKEAGVCFRSVQTGVHAYLRRAGEGCCACKHVQDGRRDGHQRVTREAGIPFFAGLGFRVSSFPAVAGRKRCLQGKDLPR